MTKYVYFLVASTVWLAMVSKAHAQAPNSKHTNPGDRMLDEYFREETRTLTDACLADVESWNDWQARRKEYRLQLREMLGLDPLPERTPLRPVVTGTVSHPEFTIEKLHFQSRPGLYVTANLYVPKNLTAPAPAVLYVCGHARAVENGVSFGNKTMYQRHGIWFARNGYVCLVIDTLQLGEIQGAHHGTYRHNQWWWNARGYTPAGVETWNAIRALDYLESRPEVDATRMAVTGRSGGGAYSWFLAALDDRVKATVPVAGITTLKNHVVDGCVEGHCDCMFFVNTYRWDYPQLAALVAPTPLLISNSDQDRIFPLDGVLHVYNMLRKLYELAGKVDKLGLQITSGPHSDTQVLRVHAFQWLNHHLKGDDEPITMIAEPLFEPQQLKVFDALPADEINTRVEELFAPQAPQPTLPESEAEWQAQRDEWMQLLREKCFAGWPTESDSDDPPFTRELFVASAEGLQLRGYDFTSQHDVTLRLYLLHRAGDSLAELDQITLQPFDADDWSRFLSAMRTNFAANLTDELPADANAEAFAEIEENLNQNGALAFIAPRGIGRTEWRQEPRERLHIRRRFMLLGQTLDGMRVWDVRRAIQALRNLDSLADMPVSVKAERDMAGIALYASLFEPRVQSLTLSEMSNSHRQGPDFLNVLRFLDVPQAVAMAAEMTPVQIRKSDDFTWEYPLAVAERLGWMTGIEVRQSASDGK